MNRIKLLLTSAIVPFTLGVVPACDGGQSDAGSGGTAVDGSGSTGSASGGTSSGGTAGSGGTAAGGMASGGSTGPGSGGAGSGAGLGGADGTGGFPFYGEGGFAFGGAPPFDQLSCPEAEPEPEFACSLPPAGCVYGDQVCRCASELGSMSPEGTWECEALAECVGDVSGESCSLGDACSDEGAVCNCEPEGGMAGPGAYFSYVCE